MNYQQMMERIKRAAPGMLETEMLLLINEGKKVFCDKTHILEGQWTKTTDGAMFYDLDPLCIAVDQANLDGQLMDMYSGNVHMIEIQN